MKHKAFTLVEILIVVIILGILATIAMLGMSEVLSEKKAEANATLVLSVKNAVQNFRLKVNDSTAVPAMASLQSHGLVTADFADQWSIVYTNGEVSNVVAK